MESPAHSQPNATITSNIFDDIIDGSAQMPFVDQHSLKNDGIFIFGEFNSKAEKHPFHVGLLLIIDKKYYKFHYDSNWEIDFAEITNINLLENFKYFSLNFVPDHTDKFALKGIKFVFERLVSNIRSSFINVVYQYPYEIDNQTFSKLVARSNSSSDLIPVSSITVTCSTLVIYTLNSIVRKYHETFNCVDHTSWPHPYYPELNISDTNIANIRISANECFNIGIPELLKDFPLSHSICTKLSFEEYL